MIFKNKEHFSHKCTAILLSLTIISNITLTCMPMVSASNNLPEKSVSIKSEKEYSWWKRIVSYPGNIISGICALGFSSFAAFIFGKSFGKPINKKIMNKEIKTNHEKEVEANPQKQVEIPKLISQNDEEKSKAVNPTESNQNTTESLSVNPTEIDSSNEIETNHEKEVEANPQNQVEISEPISQDGEENHEEKSKAVNPTESNQNTTKNFKTHPMVTGAFSTFSYTTNAIHYVVEQPIKKLVSYLSGASADEGAGTRFGIGVLGEKWMDGIRDNVHFYEMLIPGSHDSGTYSMRSSLAITQTLSIYQQLSHGVRCLDLRIRTWWGHPCIYHGPYVGAYASDIFNDINDFIMKNPSEIIFIKMETGGDSKCSERGLELTLELHKVQVLENLILTKDDLKTLGRKNLSQLTMGDMRRLKRNIIIISDYESNFFHASENLISEFDSKSRSAGTEVMVRKTLEMLNESTRRNKLNSISPINTANVLKILKGQGSPIEQEETHSKTRNLMLIYDDDFRRKANIVSLDHIEKNAEFIHHLILLNGTNHRCLTK